MSPSLSAAWKAAKSSASSMMMATGVPTVISVPGSTRYLATTASSWNSKPMVALSVSTSQRRFPAATSSPGCTVHSTIVPVSMVGESAGMVTMSYSGTSAERAVEAWKAAVCAAIGTDRSSSADAEEAEGAR